MDKNNPYNNGQSQRSFLWLLKLKTVLRFKTDRQTHRQSKKKGTETKLSQVDKWNEAAAEARQYLWQRVWLLFKEKGTSGSERRWERVELVTVSRNSMLSPSSAARVKKLYMRERKIWSRKWEMVCVCVCACVLESFDEKKILPWPSFIGNC